MVFLSSVQIGVLSTPGTCLWACEMVNDLKPVGHSRNAAPANSLATHVKYENLLTYLPTFSKYIGLQLV